MRLVDLALVLAIDTSGSISNERLAMQLGGYVQAFRQPGLVRSIHAGNCGQIAVTFVSWSDYQRQFQEVPWTVLSDQISAVAFSDAIAHAIPPTPGWTSIAGAIRFSAHLLKALPVRADRRVIGISGDGPNNDCPPPGLPAMPPLPPASPLTARGPSPPGQLLSLAGHRRAQRLPGRCAKPCSLHPSPPEETPDTNRGIHSAARFS
jgi:hypothetical protein